MGKDEEPIIEGLRIKPGHEQAESGIIVGLAATSEERGRWLDRHFGFLTYVWGFLLTMSASLHLIRSPIIYHAGIFLMYTGVVMDLMEPNKDTNGVILDCLGFFMAGFLLFTCVFAPGKCM